MRYMKLVLFISTLLIPKLIYADGKFGPEWTFTNQEMIREGRKLEQDGDKKQVDYLEALAQRLSEKFPNLKSSDKRKFQLSEDFWFFLDTDSWVIEVNSSPMTTREFQMYMPLIQETLFETAKEVGLTPHERLVGGHIHLDIPSHFNNDQLLIRNFIVDLYNHSELFMGVLEHDYMNAPPVTTLGTEALKELRIILKEFGDMKGRKFSEFFRAINDRVYNTGQSIKGNSKDQAINIERYSTIEIRGFRPQQSAEHYLDMIKLLEARIKYLKTKKEPIQFIGRNQENKISYHETNKLAIYETTVSAKKRAQTYYKYVTEAGLDWEIYKKYPVDEAVLNEANFLEKPKHKYYKKTCKAIISN